MDRWRVVRICGDPEDSMTSMTQWQAAFAFLAISAGLTVGLLAVGIVLRVRARVSSPLKERTYECGEEPAGAAWMQFNARYYLVALFFVLFDVEAVFLFPWSVAVRALGPEALAAVVTFVAVLMLGWLYGLRKEALRWQ
jgi:NADH:ubiquinone oxidoreductase subunit 3 (subunit A)